MLYKIGDIVYTVEGVHTVMIAAKLGKLLVPNVLIITAVSTNGPNCTYYGSSMGQTFKFDECELTQDYDVEAHSVLLKSKS